MVCMVLIAMSIALSSTLRMFWYHGSLSDSWILLLGLETRDLAVLPSIWPLGVLVGEINDPFVYMRRCGWNLRGWM